MISDILRLLLFILILPIIGGLIVGVDRKITARMQGRVGPPIIQPFYDFFKLLDKKLIIASPMQIVYVLGHLFFAILSLSLFVLKKDLLIIVFVSALSTICLVIGAMSVKSPYSRIGGQREIIQMISYEPVLIFYAATIYQLIGSFNIQDVINYGSPLILQLPLVFIAFIYILTIKLRKSPFDFSSSHHAHQELIRGMLTEFSGPQLAAIELAHWYEIVLLVGLLMLFFITNIYIAVFVALISFFLEILIDNLSARLKWTWMFRSSWVIGVGLCTINVVWLYLK